MTKKKSDGPQNITLEQFVSSMRKDINKFEAYWKEQNKIRSAQFPIELWEGDWYEQFLAWESSGGDE